MCRMSFPLAVEGSRIRMNSMSIKERVRGLKVPGTCGTLDEKKA